MDRGSTSTRFSEERSTRSVRNLLVHKNLIDQSNAMEINSGDVNYDIIEGYNPDVEVSTPAKGLHGRDHMNANDKLDRSINLQEDVDQKLVNVHTYVLVLDKGHVDYEKNTYNVWIELGFCYDIHQYLKSSDYFVSNNNNENEREKRLENISAKDISIPFDVLNSRNRVQRSEAHFIRRMNGSPGPFYTETPPSHDPEAYLSEEKDMVQSINLSECTEKGKFWKYETRTFEMDLIFSSTESLAPFDQIHIYLKLITANCRPGTNRIRFKLNEHETDFSLFKKPIRGYKSIGGTVIHNSNGYSSATGIHWDRLFVAISFKRRFVEQLCTYYILPFLTFFFIVIHNFSTVEELLSVSSTLVVANVALLLVKQDNVFTLSEQAVIIQIVALVISTLVMVIEKRKQSSINQGDKQDNFGAIQSILLYGNLAVFSTTIIGHYFYAQRINAKVSQAIKDNRFNDIA